MSEKLDQYAFWNQIAGPRWVEHQESHDRLVTPLSEALMQEAFPEPGEHVLEIGCGCGQLSLQLAQKVGAGGQVVGIDISKPMLAFAKERQQRERAAGAAPIDWIEADAATHTFPNAFDLLISRFGVMFFDDKQCAFANLRKAVKPGGRFALLTWRKRAEVEWMHAPLEWIAPVLPMPDLMDGMPGPFALCEGEATREMLADAGFHDVVAEPLDRELLIGATVEDALTLLLETGPAAGAIREAEPPAADEAKRLLRAGIEAASESGGGVKLRAACYIYRGKA